jgi:rubrerythrin
VFSIGDIIDLAIQIEKNGENVYRNALQKASNPSLASLFQWLADEEVQHAKWFSELKKTIKTNTDDSRLEEMGKTLLRRILGDQAFSLQDADFSNIDQIKHLVKLAIEFEQDTVLFYEMIQSVIEDKETLDQLNRIIVEEKGHVKLLQDFL